MLLTRDKFRHIGIDIEAPPLSIKEKRKPLIIFSYICDWHIIFDQLSTGNSLILILWTERLLIGWIFSLTRIGITKSLCKPLKKLSLYNGLYGNIKIILFFVIVSNPVEAIEQLGIHIIIWDYTVRELTWII